MFLYFSYITKKKKCFKTKTILFHLVGQQKKELKIIKAQIEETERTQREDLMLLPGSYKSTQCQMFIRQRIT